MRLHGERKELDDNSPTKNGIKNAKVVAKLAIDGRIQSRSCRKAFTLTGVRLC